MNVCDTWQSQVFNVYVQCICSMYDMFNVYVQCHTAVHFIWFQWWNSCVLNCQLGCSITDTLLMHHTLLLIGTSLDHLGSPTIKHFQYIILYWTQVWTRPFVYVHIDIHTGKVLVIKMTFLFSTSGSIVESMDKCK